MHTGTAGNGDVELYWEQDGPSEADAVVLVSGTGSTAVMWCRELVDPLVAAGFRVIRFDNRDVGRSTRLGSDQPYLIEDMAQDLAAVLDACDVSAAHVLGRSMGGTIALALAVRSPSRLRSLTLVYSSACLGDPQAHGLPGAEPQVVEAMAEAAFAPPPRTDDERVEARVAEARLHAGRRYDFDEAWVRAEATADVAHAPHAEPAHGLAVMDSPSLVASLGSVQVPALVLHGTADPVVPVEHGRLLAHGLGASRLVEYEGLGHEMPPQFCLEIQASLLDHLGHSNLD